MKRLIDEALELDPQTRPWRIATAEEIGEDWMVASLGRDDDGNEVYVTTDCVRASETTGGGAREDAEWIVWCRNHWGSIKEALDANGSLAGTDLEKIEARQKLHAWNSGEPIRSPMPEVAVFVLQSQES